MAPCHKPHLAGRRGLQSLCFHSRCILQKKATLFHIISIFIMFLPLDFPLLFSSYCIAPGFPNFPCFHKLLCRTGAQGLFHSQANKACVPLSPAPPVLGLVACRSNWTLAKAHKLLFLPFLPCCRIPWCSIPMGNREETVVGYAVVMSQSSDVC